MHLFDLNKHREKWSVLGGTARSQAAVMVIAAGDSEGGPDNRHDASDQWLLVLEGTGRAHVDGRSVELQRGCLLCIEAGERHEIVADTELVTVNLYAPPEY